MTQLRLRCPKDGAHVRSSIDLEGCYDSLCDAFHRIEVEAGFLGTDSAQVRARCLPSFKAIVLMLAGVYLQTDLLSSSVAPSQSAFVVKDLASGVGTVPSATLRGGEVIAFRADARRAE